MIRHQRRPLHRAAELTSGLWLATSLLLGCSLERNPTSDAPLSSASAESPPPIDPALLAFLSRARAAHHRADAFEEKNQLSRALEELGRILAGPQPRAAQPYAEVQEVLADTRARRADLRSRLGAYELALKDVEAGLALAPGPTYFRGHLFEVRGLVEERQSKALNEAGNHAAAAQARERALEAFEQAMKIQAEVIRKCSRLDDNTCEVL
jgi:tetratricopeptide (TPR) repeat protein